MHSKDVESTKPRRVSRVRSRLRAPEKPALYGSNWPLQKFCNLFVGLALKIAKDNWQSVFIGEAIDFFMKSRLEIIQRDGSLLLRCHVSGTRYRGLSFLISAPRGTGAGSNRYAISDFVKPARQHPPIADCVGLSREGKKCCLERILGVVFMMQCVSANTHNHRAMTTNDRPEG